MTPKTVEYFIFLPEVREFIKDTNFINPTARARATDSDTLLIYYTVVCVYTRKKLTRRPTALAGSGLDSVEVDGERRHTEERSSAKPGGN